jgi:hypothetical protein
MAVNIRSDSRPFVVVLYGSKARGDDDALSDCDVVIVGGFGANHADRVPAGACVVHYEWGEFSEMAKYGSLFLKHLGKDGIVLDGDVEGLSRYTTLINTLPKYARVERDLRSFEIAIEDAISALDLGDTTPEFELACIATVIRHASILGCYLGGQLEFGRHQSLYSFCKLRPLPPAIADEFSDLYMFRMSYMRQVPCPPGATVAYTYEWCHRARLLLKEVNNLAFRPCVSQADSASPRNGA